MKPKWLIALALVVVMVWCSGVAAGPRRPDFGDPDIVEGMKPREKISRLQIQDSSTTPLVIRLFVFNRVLLIWQEREEKPSPVAARQPAVYESYRSRR